MNLTLLYRGPLSSCNYACTYCPFHKHWESPEELEADRKGLARFVEWSANRTSGSLSILFTPWGEALVRSWYREALTRLSNLNHIQKVAVQTNLSCSLDWLEACDRSKLGLWCTYHPTQVARKSFLIACEELRALGVRFSVGMVGLPDQLDEIEAFRAELPDSIYLWVNADHLHRYTPEEIQRLSAIDPLFPLNLKPHPSRGKACRTGSEVLSVDGDGNVTRCHFVDQPLGNLYQPDFESNLQALPCPNRVCHCHIGYVHLEELELQRTFGTGLLERIPSTPLWQRLQVSNSGL